MSRRTAGQALVESLVVIVGKVRLQLPEKLLPIGGLVQVNVLPFHGAPEALDEGVVGGSAPPVAADAAAHLQQGLLVGRAGELAALVRVGQYMEPRPGAGLRPTRSVQKSTASVLLNSQLST